VVRGAKQETKQKKTADEIFRPLLPTQRPSQNRKKGVVDLFGSTKVLRIRFLMIGVQEEIRASKIEEEQ